MSNRSDMPKKNEILNYWGQKIIDNFGKYWMDVVNEKSSFIKTSYCFVCGSNVGTQRCHIIPLDSGGTNSITNIHLLCNECHIESENFKNIELYNEWLKYKNPSNSGSMLRLKNIANVYEKAFSNGNLHLLPKEIQDYFIKYQK
jgi:hypothetical protein